MAMDDKAKKMVGVKGATVVAGQPVAPAQAAKQSAMDDLRAEQSRLEGMTPQNALSFSADGKPPDTAEITKIKERINVQQKLDDSRRERTADLSEGRARGQEIFKDGSLGRLSEGYSAEEQSAMRDQNLGTINANNSNNLRQLRIQQAAQGLRGGQATAQIARARNEQGGQVASAERDLFLKNIDARRDSQKFNIDQGAREKQAQLTTELGYGALGSADRGAALQAMVGEKQALAAANSGGGGKK